MDQDKNRRTLFILLAAASAFGVFSTTERCFGKADVRNAIALVQTLRASPAAPTIPDALAAAHPDATPERIAWSGTLNDNFYGFVRVRAAVPGPGAVEEYFFDVNLSGQRLHPGNERAKELMNRLREGGLSGAPPGPTLPETGTAESETEPKKPE